MRQNKLTRIGITGGMGAGKSTVAGIFEAAGLLVIDADMVSRDVLEEYPEVHDGAQYKRRQTNQVEGQPHPSVYLCHVR